MVTESEMTFTKVNVNVLAQKLGSFPAGAEAKALWPLLLHMDLFGKTVPFFKSGAIFFLIVMFEKKNGAPS